MNPKKVFFIFLLFAHNLSSWAIVKHNNNHTNIEKTKNSKEKYLYKNLDKRIQKKQRDYLSKDLMQNNKYEIDISNHKKIKYSKNLKNKFYLNFAFGQASLNDYDVYDTSTNKAIWDDRYTKLGSTFEFGFGYDFGKIRTELSYARENGRFDEYLTYSNNSITKINEESGKLHKDFYLVNAYYDFRENKRFSPFIGMGIGFVNSFQDSAPFIPEYLRQAFVIQLKGGFSFKLSGTKIIFIEGFRRNANSHTTNDGLGTPYIYESKNGFDSFGYQIGLRKIL